MDRSSIEEIDEKIGDPYDEKNDCKNTQGGEAKKKIVPLYKLFSLANPVDIALMILGVIGTTANRIFVPMMSFLIGNLVDSFGITAGSKLVSEVSKDITFFDMETDAGEVVSRMSGDIVLIQDAMGEKVGKSIQLISTFMCGFVISFIRGWLLALVMIATVPFLVLLGALMSAIINKLATRGQVAYSEAAAVVEQTICSIKMFPV